MNTYYTKNGAKRKYIYYHTRRNAFHGQTGLMYFSATNIRRNVENKRKCIYCYICHRELCDFNLCLRYCDKCHKIKMCIPHRTDGNYASLIYILSYCSKRYQHASILHDRKLRDITTKFILSLLCSRDSTSCDRVQARQACIFDGIHLCHALCPRPD